MAEAVIMRRRLRRRNVGPLFADDFKGLASPGWKEWRLGKYDVPPVQTPNTSPNLAYVGDPLDSSQYCMRVTVNGGDYVNAGDKSIGKQRAQLAWTQTVDQHRAYRELWYAIGLYFPTDFDYNTDIPNGDELFYIPIEWHDRIFEETGASPGNQPVCSVSYEQSLASGLSSFKLAYGLEGIGDTRQILDNVVIDRGRWHNLRFHFRWSRGDDGFCRVFLNGNFLIRANGRNIYPAQGDTPNRESIGTYRGHGSDPEQTQTTIHYMRRFSVAPTEQRLGLGA